MNNSAVLNPLHRYSPRVAVVTGAAQGIGYSIVHRLADDGIDIAVNDVHAKAAQVDVLVAELREKGRRAVPVLADVSSEQEVIGMIKKTVQELGSVDIMIANAGIGSICPFLGTTVEQFDSAHAVNSRGVFLCYKHAALQMINQGLGGRLIGASSAAGIQGGPNVSAYAASKFAIRGITHCASHELQKYGITVNTYAPGIIDTPLTHLSDREDDNHAALKNLFGMPPDTRAAGPDSVASIVSYLVKPEAYFINGQSISVDGGYRLS
ncbi:hypothetical protein M0805_000809 [Coniferiporia weirii]|nr:hypothetical protein M0805_000809 [Coniferiporia weirii]